MANLSARVTHDTYPSGRDEGYSIHFDRGPSSLAVGELTVEDLIHLDDVICMALNNIDDGEL